jgi:glutathione S-transferase
MSILNNASAFLVSVLRLGRGLQPRVTRDQRPAPKQLLELYEFEACPYCRKVREVLCELDLDYIVHPVAHGSPRRAELKRRGGKVQVPYLVDPNTATEMYESDDIMAYLNERYGAGRRAGWSLPLPGLLDNLGSAVASVPRLRHGRDVIGTQQRPDHLAPLELYNMEGSPFCRKVREALSELDLVHIIRSVPKGSPQRADLLKRGGKVMVPYLIDPNRQREMYESDDIIAYLRLEYGS